MDNKLNFFDFAAEVGLTKQIGGLKATDELIELCHIDKGSYVLDVGCGVGVTPCYLAERHGCRVVGVDIRDRMIERSNERAKREGLEDRVEFRVADAQDLPFEDDLFDAVICESVLAIVPDKPKAMHEYVRVTKAGGYVGLNESTWIKTPPPVELVEWAGQDLGGSAQLLSADGWVELLESAGLREVTARTYKINIQNEARGLLRRYGCIGMLGIWGRMLSLYARSPAYRRFTKKTVGEGGVTPENLDEYFGYGLYVGRK